MMRLKYLACAFLFLLLLGCCNFMEPDETETPGSPGGGTIDIGNSGNNAPEVEIRVKNITVPEGATVRFNYTYYDEDGDLEMLELRVDGKTFAKGKNATEMFPDDYEYPQTYLDSLNQRGTHALEIYAIDENGNTASDSNEFVVVAGPRLTAEGWYTCNNRTNPPCDSYAEAYCDKYAPADVSVRAAASAATEKHPGAYSVNQLLDIYDWVHGNVKYLNVPVDFTYQPFAPTETLKARTGDCKNQAVLLASMVESIGGTARVLLIPECEHAFAEVYVGSPEDKDAFNEATWAHYNDLDVPNKSISWHYANNKTEVWMPFDTAGGAFPGTTLPGCLDAKTVFVIYNCNRTGEITAPSVENIEYGPFEMYNRKQVIGPDSWWYFNYSKNEKYSFCRYNISMNSPRLFSWYIIPAGSYEDFQMQQSYRQYYNEEGVQNANYIFDWDRNDVFDLIIYNKNQDMPMTIDAKIIMTCYI